MERQASKGATTGDSMHYLVQVGAFSALYFVIMFTTGMIGFVGPVFMFVGWVIGIVFNGIVVMLYLARTRCFGAMALLGLVVGLIMVAMGHYWMTGFTALALGAVADLISRAGFFGQRMRDALAYAIFSLWLIAPLMPIFFSSDVYFADIARKMDRSYADAMQAIFTPTVLYIWAGIIALLGCAAGLLGTKIVAKHFVRAGMV